MVESKMAGKTDNNMNTEPEKKYATHKKGRGGGLGEHIIKYKLQVYSRHQCIKAYNSSNKYVSNIVQNMYPCKLITIVSESNYQKMSKYWLFRVMTMHLHTLNIIVRYHYTCTLTCEDDYSAVNFLIQRYYFLKCVRTFYRQEYV